MPNHRPKPEIPIVRVKTEWWQIWWVDSLLLIVVTVIAGLIVQFIVADRARLRGAGSGVPSSGKTDQQQLADSNQRKPGRPKDATVLQPQPSPSSGSKNQAPRATIRPLPTPGPAMSDIESKKLEPQEAMADEASAAPPPTSGRAATAVKSLKQPEPTDSADGEIGSFLFSIEGCRVFSASYNPDSNVFVSRTAGKVECHGTVTNRGIDRAVLVVDDRRTNIVDNLGNQSTSGIIYNMSKSVVQIGTRKTWGPGGTVSQELEPSLPLIFQVSGVGLSENATSASIVLVTTEGRIVIRSIRLNK
ncbi:MAG TPA: hypothetical protein VEI26_05895 [Terriglobales bacterium]|nr:hypothetical protein [Terriglobales bacterium]